MTKDIRRVMDDHIPAIEADFMGWVQSTLSATDWDEFQRLLEGGDFAQAANLIQWSDYAPEAAIGAALGAAALANSENLGELVGVKIAFDLKNPLALDWIEKHGAELVAQVDEPTKKALREVIYRGYFSGYTPREQAKYIKGLVGLDERRMGAVDNYAKALQRKGLSPSEINQKAARYSEKLLKQRARTIAVNEASEAATRGQYFSTKDAVNRGIMSPREWEGFRIVADDERLCDRCAPLEGEGRSLPDGVYPSTGSVTTKVHVLCLPPDAKCIAPGGLVAITRSKYSGELFRFTLSDGTTFTVTRNHLLLTPNGFAAAHLIRQGDDIIYCPVFEGRFSSNPNEDGYIPTVEEIFNSLSEDGGVPIRRVPVAPEDLHGDGRFVDGYIDIVGANSLLEGTAESSGFQHIPADVFYRAGVAEISLPCPGHLASTLEGYGRTADSVMGGLRQSHPFFFRRLAHPEEHGFTSVPLDNSSFIESGDYVGSGMPDLFGNSLDRHAGFIERGNVVHIREIPYHGYVYDLQSISTLLICNGAVISNCRCTEGYRKIITERVKMKQATRTTEAVSSRAEVIFEAKGIKETDESIFVPTVPMVEGVFEGHGFPALRLYDEFAEYAKWFEGLAVVPNHEPIDPDARRIGQIRDPKAEAPKKRVKATTEFYKIDLTQRELEKLRSKKPSHGSLAYSCYMEYEPGEYNGTRYEAIERGPYVFYEYSMVRNGVVTPDDGAGFHVERSQSPAHRATNKGDNKMTGDPTPGHEPGITEAVKPLIAEAVEAAKAELKAEYQARIDTLEAEKKARDLLAFQESLKPGHRAEAATLYEALLKDPIGWVRENASKLAAPVDETKLKGSPVTEGAPKRDHQAEMRAVYGE